jgi:hypothetical protein
MLDKEDSLFKDAKALDVFMALPDELVIDIIKYDKEGLYMMCLALTIEFLNKESPDKSLAN